MADFNLGGLLSGGGGLYDDLLTPQQQSQLSGRGLLAMASAFADAAMPSRLPIPLGAAIGKAAAAMGAGRDEAALSLLKAGMTAQELKALQQKMKLNESLTPFLQRLAAGNGAGVLTPAGVPQSEPLKATPGAPGYGRLTPPGPAAAGGQYAPPAGLLQGGLDSDPSSGYTGVMLPPAPPGYDSDLAGPPAAPAAPAMKASSSLDTVLPRPGGPGGLLAPASYNGASAPGGGNAWLNANAPFPTMQRPGGAPIQWANAPPSGVPFGQDPGDALPGGGAGTPPFGGRGQGGEIPGAGGDDEVGSGGGSGGNWETAHNNLGGMRIPGVNATPTQGGFQSFSTPEQGLAAISRQLDRYASGATTGRPLTTIKDIVSTWAPPSENPTETLIQRAERVMGVGRNVPLDLSNPATKAKLIEATIRNEQGDRLPVDPSLISKVAGASQYSGGLPGGGSGGGAAPGTSGGALATPPGAGAALATPSGGGVIPGTGMTPQQLGALNALMKMGGLGDPFNSLLETYYKSPGYLGEAKRATEQVETEFAGPKAANIAAATQKYIQENETHKSGLDLARDLIGKGVYFDKETGSMKPITNAAQALAEIDRVKEQNKADLQLIDTTLTFPGETQPRTVQMTGAQARAVAEGRGVQIGGVNIPPMTGIQLGKPVPSEEDKAGIQARGAAQTEMYKAGQKALDTAHDAVRGANQRAPYYGSMLTAMQGFQPGATAELRLTGMQYLRDLGIIKGDNVPQGEALRLAGERLAFLAVPPNQGSWSNVERQLLKSSIAGMSMTPGGLTDAIRMMQQLDDYDRKVSEIHRQVADKNQGLPNLLEAQRRVEALGPPLSPQQEAALERLRQPAAAPGGGANEIIQNGWRYDATTHRPIGPVQ